MATWKITVKGTTTYNGVHLEKGMFVEYVAYKSFRVLKSL